MWTTAEFDRTPPSPKVCFTLACVCPWPHLGLLASFWSWESFNLIPAESKQVTAPTPWNVAKRTWCRRRFNRTSELLLKAAQNELAEHRHLGKWYWYQILVWNWSPKWEIKYRWPKGQVEGLNYLVLFGWIIDSYCHGEYEDETCLIFGDNTEPPGIKDWWLSETRLQWSMLWCHH